MQELRGRVAVVTGAASGIGRALAERFAAEGMKVVLADVDREGLAQTEASLRGAGRAVLGVPTDVSNGVEVAALAARAVETFGAVDVLCNNAGVGGGAGPLWTISENDWAWTLGVNLWGVIHGIRAFVPAMVARGEGHVVNTASVAGLLTPPMIAPYVASKHAVVSLSEVLARDLDAAGSKVKVSVLCPGWVRTGIADSERHRPAHLRNPAGDDPMRQMMDGAMRSLIAGGIEPEVVAECVVSAIAAEHFYVLPHPEFKSAVRARMEDIVEERSPKFDPRAFA